MTAKGKNMYKAILQTVIAGGILILVPTAIGIYIQLKLTNQTVIRHTEIIGVHEVRLDDHERRLTIIEVKDNQ